MFRLKLAVLVLSVCFACSFAPAQCGSSTISIAQSRLSTAPKPIRDFAAVIDGSITERDELLISLAEKHFGSPARSIGSGIIRYQWEIAGGVLTVGGQQATYQTKRGKWIWLTPDRTKAVTALTGRPIEMTMLPNPRMRYWLGDVYLKRNGIYEFIDSGPEFAKQRREQNPNFLIAHPKGTYAIQFARGCGPTTMLQNQPEGTVIGTLTFIADSSSRETFSVIYSESSRRLSLRSRKAIEYRLEN